ncbi:hypothetical protein BDQ12DRAFT_673624 [Crucibulum laeve]|uniref:peptidylprolyl isomerase n=1 Tax=Crucibulum laeve TaxID=68775 RepID=A0A5C3MIU7_9AGAR|nr:hypothetical protein BDQ12DRAFT_673624 [Crucibulum laeve]
MSIAIGVWSIILTPGKEEVVVPQADLRITNAALGDELADAIGRTTVKFTYDTLIRVEDEDEEIEAPPTTTTILCSLTGGKVEQVTTDLILEENEEYTFQVVGKNAVYLTGNYIDQTAANQPPFGDDSDEDDEDDYDLREVSSDVEMDPAELGLDDVESDASRFEEVQDEEPVKSQKRPRESDADASKASKTEKKQNKKLKAEGGAAVPAGEEAEDKKDGKKDKKDKKDKKEAADKPKVVEREIAGGIKIKDTKVGTGPAAKKGNTVSMRYIGKLTNGKVFDSNTKGKPFTFHLGRGEVIKGWDEGILGMQVGGERKLTLPPAMGYGKRGTDGIPGNSTLIFEVKLMEIK